IAQKTVGNASDDVDIVHRSIDSAATCRTASHFLSDTASAPGMGECGIISARCPREHSALMQQSSSSGAAAPIPSRHIRPETKLLLAVAAGGRCEFAGCNKYLFEHPITLSGLNLSENAHIYAFKERGARGSLPGRPLDIHSIENLMLLCGDCHK